MDITYNICSGCEKKEDCEIRRKYSRYMRTHPIICESYKRTDSLCDMCYWRVKDICVQGNAVLELLGVSKLRSKCNIFRLKNGVDPDKEEMNL